METTFVAAIHLCFLSEKDAADFLDMNPSMVMLWATGEESPPKEAWQMLADLYERIESAAGFASPQIIPELMGRDDMNFIKADSLHDPLPGEANAIAGAMALLKSLK
ncbi:hypothetical protein [Paracoccus sp. KR1-242]|uniref:hypothetical protein n=1 Tax=Paracoccus sp. KR1-242 TaxID=3410028 RepID=UPI003BFBDD55